MLSLINVQSKSVKNAAFRHSISKNIITKSSTFVIQFKETACKTQHNCYKIVTLVLMPQISVTWFVSIR